MATVPVVVPHPMVLQWYLWKPHALQLATSIQAEVAALAAAAVGVGVGVDVALLASSWQQLPPPQLSSPPSPLDGHGGRPPGRGRA
jgi:hypothetical protein